MNNVHKLFDDVIENQEELEESSRDNSRLGLQSSGGGGTGGGMEERVTKLENDVKSLDGKFDSIMARFDKIDQKFDKMDSELKTIIKDVAEIKGRLSAMPSTWQLLAMIVAIMGFSFTLSFALMRFGMPS